MKSFKLNQIYKLLLIGGVYFGSGALALIQIGCSSSLKSNKVVLDESPEKPDWVDESKLSWTQDEKIFFKSSSSIQGNERLDACFTLARLEAKTTLLTEISEDVKGAIDNAQTSISENAEIILSQVRSGSYKGRISGLRFQEQYFQRYLVRDVERIDCFVASSISKFDYQRIRSGVLNELSQVDSQIKKAILKKQISFFEGDEERLPAKIEVKKEEVTSVDVKENEKSSILGGITTKVLPVIEGE